MMVLIYALHYRIAAMLGGAALQIWAGIRTHNTMGPPEVVQSVAVIYTYSYLPSDESGLAVSATGAASRELHYKQQTFQSFLF